MAGNPPQIKKRVHSQIEESVKPQTLVTITLPKDVPPEGKGRSSVEVEPVRLITLHMFFSSFLLSSFLLSSFSSPLSLSLSLSLFHFFFLFLFLFLSFFLSSFFSISLPHFLILLLVEDRSFSNVLDVSHCLLCFWFCARLLAPPLSLYKNARKMMLGVPLKTDSPLMMDWHDSQVALGEGIAQLESCASHGRARAAL